MKMLSLITAGLVAATTFVPAAASAQRHDREVREHTTVVRHGRGHAHKTCRIVRDHHHSRRVCRTVYR